MKKLFFVIAMTLTVSAFALPCVSASASAGAGEITARSAYLMDYNSGTVIYAKNENDRLTIASMTKIMLLDLCYEKLEAGEFTLDEEIRVSKTASGMGGSQVFLEADKNYKASELLKSITVASANDASVAMAERLYGSEQNCVDEMNKKCEEWGLRDTLFSNCTGLPKPTQYSCAKDVAVMLKNLLKHKEYFTFSKIWTDKIEHAGGRNTEISNTNKLIRFYDGCDGGKTGYTTESGFCLAASAKRGATRLVSVIINASDSKTRFKETSELLDYGFDNYATKMVVDCEKPLDIAVNVSRGKQKSVKVIPEENVYIFSQRNKKDAVDIDFVPEQAVAPVLKGDVVGRLVVYKDNVEYASVNVLACEDVEKKTYFDYIKDVSANWE
ncbi:MAG: D-alanyl-D-alanine carboxypeptidase, partial [Clostridia bacterium]|nr:D-alanyl-D-alanine carboxypeptidase [Clostridia bacterium]